MILTTQRLFLRPFTHDDFTAVHSYASDADNTKYMPWGPNDAEMTHEFIKLCVEKSDEIPRTHYDFAVTQKESGRLIGGCGIYLNKDLNEGMLGYILHKYYWGSGYAGELAAELIRFGFEELGLHRIYATCNAQNYASYHVMEKNGMRREAHFKKSRSNHGEWTDELHYAILDEEWFALRDGDRLVKCSENDGYDIYEMLQEIPSDENGFVNGASGRPYREYKDWLKRCVGYSMGQDLSEGHVPQTIFWYYKGLRPAGYAKLRHYLNDSLLITGGHIGYCIRPSCRGKGYASKMLSLVLPKAAQLGISKVLVTVNDNNLPSARTTEKNGGVLEKTENGIRYYWINTDI